MFERSVCVLSLIAAAASGVGPAEALATCSGRPIALSGTDGTLGPGQGPGVMFTGLGSASPVINSAGQAHFRGNNTASGNPAGLWVHSGGANTNTALSGGAQPGGGTYPSTFNFVFLNDAGHTAWRNGNNSGLFADVGSGPGVVMLSATAAPGTGGANFSSFSTSPLQLLTGDGRMVFRAGLTASTTSTPPTTTTPAATANAAGIWGGAPGAVSLLARQNDTIPSLSASDVRLGAPDTTSGAMVMNNAGTLLFTAALQGTVTTSGATSNNQALIRSTGGVHTVVARRGDAFPGAAAGENYNTISLPSINNAGTMAYTSTLRGGAITGTVAGLFSDTTGTMTQHVRTGTAMPAITAATGGSFAGLNWGGFFSNLSINGNGGLAFANTGITGPGVTSGAGIFTMDSAGVFEAVCQLGDVAPGAMSFVDGDTVKIGTFQGGIAHNARGQVAFTSLLSGTLAGGIFGGPGGNNSALWATDLNGNLCLIAQKGMPFEVAPGDIRTVSDANLFQAVTSGNEDGARSIFNDNGDLVFALDFADGSSGVFVVNIPAPGSAGLLAAAGVLAMRRRRNQNLN